MRVTGDRHRSSTELGTTSRAPPSEPVLELQAATAQQGTQRAPARQRHSLLVTCLLSGRQGQRNARAANSRTRAHSANQTSCSADQRTCVVLPEIGAGAAGAAVGGLRSGCELVAGRPPGSGRGRRADGARECAVLAGDVPGTQAGRSARRPRLPGRPGAVLDCRADRRALSRESRGAPDGRPRPPRSTSS